MTTKTQAMKYLEEHLESVSDRKWAVYNPLDKPLEELPVIYGFNNGGRPGWYYAQLISEDGMGLGSHVCSDECYMEFDLGILEGSRSDRHVIFSEYYPEGYKMEFVKSDDINSHQKLQCAFELNKKLKEAAENADTD